MQKTNCLKFMLKAAQQEHNVETTSIQRLDVESTFKRRCFNVVYLLEE